MKKCYWTSRTYLHKVFNLATKPFVSMTLSAMTVSIVASASLLSTNLSFAAPSAAKPLNPYKAVYQTKMKGMSITAKRKLQAKDDGSYALSMDTSSVMVKIKESTTFSVNKQQIISHHYRYEQSGVGKNRKNKLAFDWDKKIATDKGYDPAILLETPEGTLDRLNSQLQIRLDLAAMSTNKQSTKQLPAYTVVDKKRLKEYDFQIIGEEQLKTPLGKLNTVKIQRQRTNSQRKTYIWYASDWDYLLVKLEQIEDDGGKYELNITEAAINGTKITGLK